MRLRWVLGHLHPVADPCAPTSCRGAGPMGPDSAALTVSYLVCRIERVVLTLGMTAQVLARDILVGFAHDARAFIAGITHARGGKPGQPGVQVGAQLRR